MVADEDDPFGDRSAESPPLWVVLAWAAPLYGGLIWLVVTYR